jgi:hypothetical protein
VGESVAEGFRHAVPHLEVPQKNSTLKIKPPPIKNVRENEPCYCIAHLFYNFYFFKEITRQRFTLTPSLLKRDCDAMRRQIVKIVCFAKDFSTRFAWSE